MTSTKWDAIFTAVEYRNGAALTLTKSQVDNYWKLEAAAQSLLASRYTTIQWQSTAWLANTVELEEDEDRVIHFRATIDETATNVSGTTTSLSFGLVAWTGTPGEEAVRINFKLSRTTSFSREFYVGLYSNSGDSYTVETTNYCTTSTAITDGEHTYEFLVYLSELSSVGALKYIVFVDGVLEASLVIPVKYAKIFDAFDGTKTYNWVAPYFHMGFYNSAGATRTVGPLTVKIKELLVEIN